jgi:hypothetical protein
VILPKRVFAVGYRLLVDTLTDEDREAETALSFGDRFDVITLSALPQGNLILDPLACFWIWYNCPWANGNGLWCYE